jgi:hypothetical protein
VKRRPVDWSEVSGAERLAAWHALAAFVEALVYRHQMHVEVASCWWRHSDVVEELSALWQFRQFSFGEDADLNGAMQWQDALDRGRSRLRLLLVSCRDGHVDTSMAGRPWMTDAGREAFAEAVRRDVEDRDVRPTE